MLGVQGQPELHSIRCQDYIAKDTITEKRGRRDIHKSALQVVSVEADVTENKLQDVTPNRASVPWSLRTDTSVQNCDSRVRKKADFSASDG